MLKAEQVYPSDLTDQQWECIRVFIPSARRGGRPRKTAVREVLNAIFYMNRTGCAWRYLPRQFPLWQTVYMYYIQWKTRGVLKQIHDFLVTKVRVLEGRKPVASVLIVDAQSSKAQWGENRGWDGFKKVKGRKRSVLVDSLGLIHGLRVDAANRQDHQCALPLLDPEDPHFPQNIAYPLQAFYADGAYKAVDFQYRTYQRFKVWPTLKISENQVNQRKNARILIGSNLKPTRWVVERTFGWFNYYRRLARDYEKTTSSSEAMIQIAMSRMMLTRLTRPKQAYSRWK